MILEELGEKEESGFMFSQKQPRFFTSSMLDVTIKT